MRTGPVHTFANRMAISQVVSSIDVIQRFRLVAEMQEAGIEIMRQNLKRRHPGESEDEIERRLRDWLREWPLRPGGSYA